MEQKGEGDIKKDDGGWNLDHSGGGKKRKELFNLIQICTLSLFSCV